MTKVSVYLPDDLVAAVERIARDEMRSVSSVVAMMVRRETTKGETG